MLVELIIDNVQSTLQTTGVYRSSDFILKGVNDALKLTGYLTLYDERKSSVSAVGTRNVSSLCEESGANMIAPIFINNSVSGNRVYPVRMIDFELSSTNWEGVISGEDSDYYIVLNPIHPLETELLCTPIQNSGSVGFDLVGAFIPDDVVSTDTLDFPSQYSEALYFYALFHCFISMPGRTKECLDSYKSYIKLINQMVRDLASRFPSDQGIKPVPVEFNYDTLTRHNMDGRTEQEASQETQ